MYTTKVLQTTASLQTMASAEEILSILGTYAIGVLVVGVLIIIAWWKLFEKAGQAGWKSLIPFYSSYIMFKIAWKTGMFWTLVALAVLSSVVSALGLGVLGVLLAVICAIALMVIGILFNIKLAAAYGKGGGFAVGLIFLGTIFILILGFGKAEYVGPQK